VLNEEESMSRRSVPWSFATVLALAFAASTALAAEKRAFALPDLYRLKGVEEPAVAPDGRSIVYRVTTSDLTSMKREANLWRVEPDGANAQALTFADKTDYAPRFSPDGKTLYFLSTRNGDPQVFSMSGGEPRARTDVPGGVGSFTLSGNGHVLAVSADVWVDCGADAACNKKKDEARSQSKLKAHLSDRLLYRHWTEWRDAKRAHVLVFELAKPDAPPRDVTPGDFDSPTFSVGGPLGMALSPDGKELSFTSNREADEASTTNADLWTVAVDGSADELARPRNLTGANKAWDGSPAYSPDGRWLAYRTQKVPGWEADRFRIGIVDRRTAESRILTEGFDNTIGEIAWSADSKKIYFAADVKGRTPLHEMDVASGRIRVLTDVGLLDAFAVAPDGTWAVVARRRVGEPVELHRIDLREKSPAAPKRLTTHNAAVEAEVDIRPAEEITVAGAGGKPVQVFIVKPHGFDPAKKYPLILNIHGGPQSQWTDGFRGDWQVYPGLGYVVAFPNPHGSTGFGEAYTAAISRDWDGKVLEDIAKVTDAVAALPYVDADRMGVMGWSWGGYAVMWLQGHSTRFKAMASMMGVYDLRSMYSSTEELWFPHWDLSGAPWESPAQYQRVSPSSYVTGFKTPCLVITGEKDYRVPYSQSLMFFTDLQKRGVPSRLLVFENAGHWPSWYEMGLYYAAHADWFHRYLGGDASPFDPRELARGGAFGSK
jgi:dipeptidyl aminopeptidase/acylaminoacyl peptidase